jgi:hypothetical protein
MDPNTSNESSIMYSLDDLLDLVGILPIDIYTYHFIIPVIAFIGCILCTLSLWIFFKKKFSAPIYWYFKAISIANIIQLVFAIPYGICFTPKYIPNMNSYSCAIVQCVYIPFEAFSSHLVAILEIAVLLEGIKIMNPLVKKHFTISARNMIVITFIVCLLSNSIYGLLYAPYNLGDFYYYDSNQVRKINSFWFLSTSPLA